MFDFIFFSIMGLLWGLSILFILRITRKSRIKRSNELKEIAEDINSYIPGVTASVCPPVYKLQEWVRKLKKL